MKFVKLDDKFLNLAHIRKISLETKDNKYFFVFEINSYCEFGDYSEGTFIEKSKEFELKDEAYKWLKNSIVEF